GFAHGIEGARADVAVDDADRPQRERPETGPRTRVGAAFARNHGSLNGGNLGPRVFACYLGHGGRVNPDASQNGRRLISPLTRTQHAQAGQVPPARRASPDPPAAITSGTV